MTVGRSTRGELGADCDRNSPGSASCCSGGSTRSPTGTRLHSMVVRRNGLGVEAGGSKKWGPVLLQQLGRAATCTRPISPSRTGPPVDFRHRSTTVRRGSAFAKRERCGVPLHPQGGPSCSSTGTPCQTQGHRPAPAITSLTPGPQNPHRLLRSSDQEPRHKDTGSGKLPAPAGPTPASRFHGLEHGHPRCWLYAKRPASMLGRPGNVRWREASRSARRPGAFTGATARKPQLRTRSTDRKSKYIARLSPAAAKINRRRALCHAPFES